MVDPYDSPAGETPVQRRDRLMNLTNPAWSPAAETEPSPLAGGGGPEAAAGSPVEAPAPKAQPTPPAQ